MTCETRFGLCQHCYGSDLARGGLIGMGEAAASSRPVDRRAWHAAHLRTFLPAVCRCEDITRPARVEELFEARTPKGEAVIAEIGGVVDVYWTPTSAC